MIISTFNVHSMQDADALKKTAQILKDNKVEIACFQEIQEDSLKELAEILGYEWYYYGGNGVISCENLEVEKIALPYNRHAMVFRYMYHKIVCTHLDHKYEKRRMEQLRCLDAHMDADIFVGDLNSLQTSDYSKEQLKKITDERRKDNWELPLNDVTDYLKSKEFVIDDYRGGTCRFGTRIDYIMYKMEIESLKDVIVDTIQMKLSDHKMLISWLIVI